MMEMVENISLQKSINSLKRAQRKTHLIFIYMHTSSITRLNIWVSLIKLFAEYFIMDYHCNS